MSCQPLGRRLVVGLALALILASPLQGDTPAKRKTPAPVLPPLNQGVLDVAREQLGRKVGDGQCTSLATEALGRVGARRYPWDPNGDFVWGRPVASFKEALPGDVVQFRDAVFEGKRWVTKRRWVSWHQEYPHHTAIVSAVRDSGFEVVFIHQNVGADDAANVVREDAIRPRSLKDGGKLWIYRPEPRGEARSPDQTAP